MFFRPYSFKTTETGSVYATANDPSFPFRPLAVTQYIPKPLSFILSHSLPFSLSLFLSRYLSMSPSASCFNSLLSPSLFLLPYYLIFPIPFFSFHCLFASLYLSLYIHILIYLYLYLCLIFNPKSCDSSSNTPPLPESTESLSLSPHLTSFFPRALLSARRLTLVG